MTGTIQDAAVLVIQNLRHDALQLGFTNSQGVALAKGDEVYLHTDESVKLRSTGAQIPCGVVVVGADNGKRVTVRTYFTLELNVVNGGSSAIASGVAVVPLGTKNSEGYPEYDAAADGEFASAIVLVGGDSDESMLIGVLDSIFINPIVYIP